VVRVDRRDATLALTLDRPEVRNAYGARMRDELVEGLLAAEVDASVGRVELRGSGPAFCSGGDLDEFGTATDPVAAHGVRTTRSAGVHLAGMADRVTAFVHGACVGAGVELPAFAGEVVARADTTFLLPEVGMGLVPGAGGTASIPRRVGRHRAAHLALSGRPIDAATASAWGLVDRIDAAAFPDSSTSAPDPRAEGRVR
jgi:enoyl-CoA hydratase/carnithine racemase